MTFEKIAGAAALGMVSCLMLSGCAGDGTRINDDGTAAELKWHEADKVTFDKSRGTFPNLQGLSQVRDGMTKDQLYELIGRPQYEDGWRPRQWNYLFHFTTPGKGRNGITTCQYKVLFDKDGYARTFHWHPVSEEDGVCPPPPPEKEKAAPAPVPVPVIVPQKFEVSGDALFDFDKSGINDLRHQGKDALDQLAEKLKEYKTLKSVRVVGHTDRLGSDAYNMRLSMARANTVRAYFVEKGIPADLIRAEGMGKRVQVKDCPNMANREELRECLLPNRRVEIFAEGLK